ncbi:MAG: hypothetical protein ACOX3T_08050 [Bdellovibrionota bacterium]
MEDIWYLKQAKLIYSLKIDDYECFYDEKTLSKIKAWLRDITELQDFLKREIKIDTVIFS